MSLYERIAALPVHIEAARLEPREREFEFVRKTTTVRLSGGGVEGAGEDVTYEPIDHEIFQARGVPAQVLGSGSIAELCERLDRTELFPEPPQREDSRDYRRWAFESAALDLALRQAATNLQELLELEPRPVRFVVSMGLGDPPGLDAVTALRRDYPASRFKLDPDATWNPALIRQLAEADVVDVLDFKGAYEGTPVDTQPNPELARLLAESFPAAVLEDPHRHATIQEVLRSHRKRISWDAIVHSVADIEALPFRPRWVNVKPSRFGTIARLLSTYGWCREHGVRMYGGGQFELGVGRGQIQLLAALFHPEGPNDVAPLGFSERPPLAGLPEGPMRMRPARVGFAADLA